MEAVLLIDIGSTYTKLTAVDIGKECVSGTAKAFTTVNTDVNEGLEQAMLDLQQLTGIKDFSGKFACSSAAGGLKMVSVGLVPSLTAEAAKMAALSAGAKVLKTYSYELSLRETEEIYLLKPDILLLSGGTNGGNRDVILHNARLIAGIDGDFPVVIAGNKSAADEVAEILSKARKETHLCENVMPGFNVLNIEPARELIRNIFLQRIVRAKGLTKVRELADDILMPTPSAVLNAAALLSKGTGNENGLGDLLVADVGGATTDVYSIADGNPYNSGAILKGLPEPYEKRTVEGDLGVRYNALSLLEAAGEDNIAKKTGLTAGEVAEWCEKASKKPEILPFCDEKAALLDSSLASMAVKLAVERHAGRLATSYTPVGVVYVQTGKDLGKVCKVIGTGGPVIYGKNPAGILGEAMFDEAHPEMLKPKKAGFMLDRKYIMSAMGLLCLKYPDTALKIMKKELVMI